MDEKTEGWEVAGLGSGSEPVEISLSGLLETDVSGLSITPFEEFAELKMDSSIRIEDFSTSSAGDTRRHAYRWLCV